MSIPRVAAAATTLGSPRSRAEVAANVIADLAKSVSPGERLGSKEELRAQLGVSAGTLNEAMRLLINQKIVSLRPGPRGGVFAAEQTAIVRLGNAVLAREINPALVAEAQVVRHALEQPIYLDAVRHASGTQIVRMRKILERMEESLDHTDFLEFLHGTWSLHAAMAEASPNELLRNIYVSLLEVHQQSVVSADPTSRASAMSEGRERYHVHERMVDIIEARDEGAVPGILAEHQE